MRVVIIGAAGFIGTHVTAALLARGKLRDRSDRAQPITELVLADLVPAAGVPSHPGIRIRNEVGDVCDPGFLSRVLAGGVDSVFALAATLTSEAETDFAKGLAVNLHGFMRLLEACRRQAQPARLVFASSIAAFGGPLPVTVDDAVAQTPQTSYGTHKAITELLINDYSRHGFIDGRALRLPIVLIRERAGRTSVSDQVAAIVREPLLGLDVACGLSPDTRIAVASAPRVAEALLAVHDLPASAFAHTRAMNLPALTVSVGEMVDALQRFGGDRRLGRVTWKPDARLQAVVDGWPARFVSERAARLGIGADRAFDEIIAAFVAHHPPA